MGKLYLRKTVLEALHERLEFIFDRFERVVVSVSGGKDSSVLFDAALKHAVSLGREIEVFFLDQEAEYRSTITLMRELMAQPGVRPHWHQVPLRLTNATSYDEDMLFAWESGARWMREKEPESVKENTSGKDRFYPYLSWYECQWDPATTCFLVGLRSEESLNRYRAVTSHPALPGINWSSRGKGCVRLYPLYDWAFEDVWTYLGKFGVRYNRVYDYLYAKEKKIGEFRVSNLIHEKAYRSLINLQEFEPDTYEALLQRIGGIQTAARYASEMTVFSTKRKPERFQTWKAYRDFVLDTIPEDLAEIFRTRFSDQPDNERVFRQQTRQLLLNDWENNVPVVNKDNYEDNLKKWMEIL